ncbi:hypothetical protein [Hymenobacter glacialis]|uniref:hypothetical protein n=1 Tax=Hymenobacter glacialis TaxID=1908236 RepID=UPI000F7865E4|nr:hypothetical protein [Hymenobacter glacialis]
MNQFHKLISAGALATALFITGCDKQKMEVEPSIAMLSQDAQPAGSYSVTFTGTTYSISSQSTTFTYVVAPANGATFDISHFNMTLPCLNADGTYKYTASDVFNVTVVSGGNTFTGLTVTNTEGGGNGTCDLSGVPNFFKIDNFSGARNSTDSYTISFSLPGHVGTSTGTAWVKYSTICQPVSVTVPGCEIVEITSSCSFSQGFYFAKPLDNNGKVEWPMTSVTVGGTTVTQSEGALLWDRYKGKAGNVYARAFFQAASIQLSFASNNYTGPGQYDPNDATKGSVSADVALINELLSSINLKSTTAITALPLIDQLALQAAAGRIGAWIGANPC